MSRRAVIALMIGFFVVIVGIDILLAINAKTGDTYSEVIRHLWWQAPFIGAVIVGGMGVLAGHWLKTRDRRAAPLLALGFAILFAVAFLAGQWFW